MANNETIIDRQDASIRRMRDDVRDYGLVSKWLSDERVLEFVYGRDNSYDLDRVRKKYEPRVRGEGPVVPCMMLYGGQPIGLMQFYRVLDGKEYDIENVEGVYGVDLFIGEPELWDQGIGTKTLSALIDYLFGELGALRVVIDPRVSNARAIRCYERCGFSKIKVLPEHELHEGAYWDAWLMSIERAKWISRRPKTEIL